MTPARPHRAPTIPRPRRPIARGVVALALLGTLGVGCGDDDAADPEAGDSTTTPTATDADPVDRDEGTEPPDTEVVTVRAVDFAFEGLPASVPTGTGLVMENGSDVEAHEMVAVLLPDDEQRSAEELLALTDEELTAQLGEVTPALVTVAGPGATGEPVVGDGTLVEPGRYAIFCAIPTGADPEAYLNPSGDGPPDVSGGPPHFVNGMVAEITVAG